MFKDNSQQKIGSHNVIDHTNYFHRIELILTKLKVHYDACLTITHKNFNQNISRTANRFITIEKSMINEISSLSNSPVPVETHQYIPMPINNYSDMYKSNLLLITFLKQNIKKFRSPSVASLLSYWVAGLQVENDEMAKYIHIDWH
jgi:hypothetical protein